MSGIKSGEKFRENNYNGIILLDKIYFIQENLGLHLIRKLIVHCLQEDGNN